MNTIYTQIPRLDHKTSTNNVQNKGSKIDFCHFYYRDMRQKYSNHHSPF